MNRRLSALVAGGAAVLSVAALTVPAQAAGTSSTSGNVFMTADWLESELSANALMHNPNYGGFDDYGLSIDAANALAAAGGHGPAVMAIRAAIIKNESAYTTGAGFGYAGDIYAGATAKAVTIEQIGGTPTAALLARLDGRVATAAPIAGRLQDAVDPADKSGADYANVFGQAFAAQALNAAGDANATSVTSFLLKQQCAAGFFRQDFTADKTAADQTCDGAKPVATASVDTTAQAIISLLPQSSDAIVRAAITRAVAWLITVQQKGGGFTADGKTGTANTNSTGLAGYALGRANSTAQAAKAASWVNSLVVTPAMECANAKLVGDFGAVAKDATALKAAKTDGITDATSDGFRRATAPALMALTFLSSPVRTTTARIAVPTYVKAGTPTTIAVSGLASGEDNCFYDQFGATKVVGGKATVVVDKGRQVFFLDHYGPVLRAVIGALSPKTFKLSVTRGALTSSGQPVVVRTSGLAPFEAYSLYFAGTKVASGRASSTGAVKGTFTAKASGAIVFKGQYGDIRHGSAYLR